MKKRRELESGLALSETTQPGSLNPTLELIRRRQNTAAATHKIEDLSRTITEGLGGIDSITQFISSPISG